MAAQDITAPPLPIKVLRGRRTQWIDRVCPQCGIAFEVCPSHARRKFCSYACKGAASSMQHAARNAALTFEDLWAMAIPEPNSGCLLWLGAVSETGYGRHKGRPAHAVAYELGVGPIPDGLEPDHLCRVRCCIHPPHIEPVTHEENLRRAGILDRVGNLNRAKTHCPQGHPYAGDNLFVHPRGARSCRTCMRESTRRQRQARKEQS